MEDRSTSPSVEKAIRGNYASQKNQEYKLKFPSTPNFEFSQGVRDFFPIISL